MKIRLNVRVRRNIRLSAKKINRLLRDSIVDGYRDLAKRYVMEEYGKSMEDISKSRSRSNVIAKIVVTSKLNGTGLSIKEIADILGVDRTSVYYYLERLNCMDDDYELRRAVCDVMGRFKV